MLERRGAGISIANLRKEYGGGPGRVVALDGIDLTIAPGEFVCIVGPSGCGKSTLLRILAGLDTATSGRIDVDAAGWPVANAMVFQESGLFPWMNVEKNVGFGLMTRGVAAAEAGKRIDAALRLVGLTKFRNHYPHQLSGGMRKRVSLAQTLVLDPDIILMDEPFSALDVQTRQLMENEVLELWNVKKKAVLFITHDLDEAIAMSDRVVILSAGPAAHPIGEFRIDLERPRDVAEVRTAPRFVELHKAIWDVLREEVLAGYRQQLTKAA
jgi:NitT/TauT family transport system ATP-binding protein